MLFSSENGVDLSSIVNDLAGVQQDEDLTAINVALVFKGIILFYLIYCKPTPYVFQVVGY